MFSYLLFSYLDLYLILWTYHLTLLGKENNSRIRHGWKWFALIFLANYYRNGMSSWCCHSVSWKIDKTKGMSGEEAEGLRHVGREWWRVSLQFKTCLMEVFNLDQSFTSSYHTWLVSRADSPIIFLAQSRVTTHAHIAQSECVCTVHGSAATLKPLTDEVNSTDHFASVWCSSGKLWVWIHVNVTWHK